MATRKPASAAPKAAGSQVFLLPLGLTGAFLILARHPRIQLSEPLAWSFWGVAILSLAWQALLFIRSRGESAPVIERSQPRAQHYVQSLCQLGVYVYWGWFWPPVYAFAPLLLGQLIFAYIFDVLLAWTRRRPYALGFGPFPIVFSTNLFLWFRDEWFIFQFLLIAVGFLGKAFIRWHRDGRLVHIFNPSAFTLAVFSFMLLATGTTHITWAQEINTTFSLGPNIYAVLFLIGLVVMYFFAITPVTAMAAATLFVGSAVYYAVTGVPYFVDSEIPTAVFLGLHLLVTDPSTSPRTPIGRAVFGTMYGLSVIVLYGLLGALGLPTFYDKLLAVPILNLAVPTIDRVVEGWRTNPAVTALRLEGPIGRGNLAHMAVWIVFFVAMTARGATDGMHPGDALPFWQQACAEGRPQACQRLLNIEASYCQDNSGWACNELGRHSLDGQLTARDPERALAYFARACEARFQPGCVNLLEEADVAHADPRVFDLRLLLREGGLNLMDMAEPDLYARACRHGWAFACEKASASR